MTEYIIANIGGRYGRRTIEEAEAAGYVQASEPDRFGTVRMCKDCTVETIETCEVLQDLGMTCPTHHVSKE